jgi:hypothetical protein
MGSTGWSFSTQNGLPSVGFYGTATAAGQYVAVGQSFGFEATAGERLAVCAQVSPSGPSTVALQITFFNQSGGLISQNTIATGGVTGSFSRIGGFITVPAGAVTANVQCILTATGAGAVGCYFAQPMASAASLTQSSLPNFVAGPQSEPGADVTFDWTAAGIQNQSPLAQGNTLTPAQVTNTNIGINPNGTLQGAGSGQVSLSGLGAGGLAYLNGVDTETIAAGSITGIVSANAPASVGTNGSGVWVPLCTITITTSGYPLVMAISFLYNSGGWNVPGGVTVEGILNRSDGAKIIDSQFTTEFQKSTNNGALYGTFSLGYIDTPSAGTWSYTLWGTVNNGTGSVQGNFSNAFMSAMEVKR